MTKAEAAAQIAKILAQLEVDTGQRVEDIGLYRMDATSVESVGEEHIVRVVIELERPIGQRWA